MRPQLNGQTTYLVMPDGIYLRTNGADFSLKGKDLDQFFELLPFLDGHTTLEEITQGLSIDKKNRITQFLTALLKAGFLKDTHLDHAPVLTEEALAPTCSNLAFLDAFQSDASSRLASFHDKHLLIIGEGHIFTALVQASVRCGVKHIAVMRTSEGDKVPDLMDMLSPSDPAQKVQAIAPLQWDNASDVLNTVQPYDALLHVSDRPMLARAQMVNRVCIEQKKTFIQAVVVDEHVWVGPLVSAETGGCWECAWRRLQSSRATSSEHGFLFRDHTTAPISPCLALPVAILVANKLLFEVFQHFTQAGPLESVGSMIEVYSLSYPLGDQGHKENRTSSPALPDGDSPDGAGPNASIGALPILCEHHPFLAHPHCHACQHTVAATAEQFLAQMQQVQDQPALDPATFSANMAQLVDHRLGLFTALDTGYFVQAPLAVYRVGLSNPMHLGHPLEVTGVGLNRESAKVQACQRACEEYAGSLVDQRRLLHRPAVQQQTSPVVPVDQLIGVSALPRDGETWTWALDLHTQQACLLPAALAFPALVRGVSRDEARRGIGSGMSWAEAICQAVFHWCTFLSLEHMRATQRRYPQVDLTVIPMTPEGKYLQRLLQIVGEPVTISDVTGPLPVPTFAVSVGERVVAYSTHCDPAQALSMGLMQALQQYQSRQAQEPGYAVGPVPDLPRQAGRDGKGHRSSPPRDIPTDEHRWDVSHQKVPEAWSARQEWLQQMLQEHGFQAWVIPLDHDPALMRVLPFVVRVLLAKRAQKEG